MAKAIVKAWCLANAAGEFVPDQYALYKGKVPIVYVSRKIANSVATDIWRPVPVTVTVETIELKPKKRKGKK